MEFPDLIRVTSSAENIHLARKRKLAVHVGIVSVLWGYLQYCGSCSVQQGDNISTVGDSFSREKINRRVNLP